MIDRKQVEVTPLPLNNFFSVLSLSVVLFPWLVLLLLSVLRLLVLYVILALWPPAIQYQLPALFFVCVLFVLFLLFVIVLSGEPKHNQGRESVDRKLVQIPQ